MNLVFGIKKELHDLISKFEIAGKNSNLSMGQYDSEIKKFIIDLVDALIKSYDDDESYFSLIKVLNDFMAEMVYGEDNSGGWAVWTEIVFSHLNDIHSGTKDEVKLLEEIKEYYGKNGR